MFSNAATNMTIFGGDASLDLNAHSIASFLPVVGKFLGNLKPMSLPSDANRRYLRT